MLFFVILCAGFQAGAETYIVKVTKANVRAQPSTQAKIIGTLQNGLKIDVIDVENGFAHFDFMGNDGYTAVRLLKPADEDATAGSSTQRSTSKQSSQSTSVSNPKSEATIYLFYNVKHYLPSLPISFNGKYVFGMEGEENENKLVGTRYKPSMRKITINGEGKLVIACDFTWAEKPYHSELAMNISNEGVYYVELYIDNLFNAVVKKRAGIYLKLLKPKEGLKLLKKKNHFTENPDFKYTLK